MSSASSSSSVSPAASSAHEDDIERVAMSDEEDRTEQASKKEVELAKGPSPLLTGIVTAISDLLALAFSLFLVVSLRWTFGGNFELSQYWSLWPVLVVYLVVLGVMGTYAVPLNPPTEARQVVSGLALTFLAIGSFIFLLRSGHAFSRLIFLLAYPVSVLAVLEGRWLTRMFFSRRRWWGRPVVVVGSQSVGRHLMRTLVGMPELGMKAVVMLCDQPFRKSFMGIKRLGDTGSMLSLTKRYPKLTFIVIAPDLSAERLEQVLGKDQHHVSRLVVVPDLGSVRSIDAHAQDFGGVLGLKVNHRLLDRWHVFAKRVVDLLIVLAFSPLLLLLAGCIAIAIKLNSKGPVFFKHQRIGHNGRLFFVWKFRSMAIDESDDWEQFLEANPEDAKKFRRDQKLRSDPRVTAVGKFLRRSSLDELPQLWNVFCGQMSLVGPRPIVESERQRYGSRFALYKRVRPGLTGLWQISGRNNLRYIDRVWLDEHYVRNWSIWMDLFILLRTPIVVLQGRGAY